VLSKNHKTKHKHMRTKAKSQKVVSRAVKEAGFKNIKDAKEALKASPAPRKKAATCCATESNCNITESAPMTETKTMKGAGETITQTGSSFMRELRNIADAGMTDVEAYRELSRLLGSYALTRVVSTTTPLGGYAFSYSYTR
jgi:hypothetical protein